MSGEVIVYRICEKISSPDTEQYNVWPVFCHQKLSSNHLAFITSRVSVVVVGSCLLVCLLRGGGIAGDQTQGLYE